MKKLLVGIILTACASAQSIILTPSYIANVLKPAARAGTAQWTALKTKYCDPFVAYQASSPVDHLAPIYAAMEPYVDGTGDTMYMNVGTDGDWYEGDDALDYAPSLALCYITLKDGDVTPPNWSFTWKGVSLTPQQYAILAGIQAVKFLNKFSPTHAHVTAASPPAAWVGLGWRPVQGAYPGRYNRSNALYDLIHGSVDTFLSYQRTSQASASGTNVLYFNTTNDGFGNQIFQVGYGLSGPNIPLGTTVQGYVVNSSVTLSQNITGDISANSTITGIPSGGACAVGKSQVVAVDNFVPPAHSAVTLTNITGPLGTLMNGNTYYVSATGGNGASSYGLDVDAAGTTPLCIVPNQGVAAPFFDGRSPYVGSGMNYNLTQDFDNEYADRAILTGTALLYDWLHPLTNQSVATILNGLASQLPSGVTSAFKSGGTAWNYSTNPWTDGTATAYGTYPQAIPTVYSTLRAQALDTLDAWTREQLVDYFGLFDVYSFGVVASNYHWGHFAGLGLAGIAAYNDDSRAQVWYNYWRNDMLLASDQPFVTRWFGPNGNMVDAFNYLPMAVRGIVLTLGGNYTAMGDNLISNSTYPFAWIGSAEYFKHNLEPNGKSQLDRGLTVASSKTPPICLQCFTADTLYPVQYILDLRNDPLASRFRSFVTAMANQNGISGSWAPFLFWNPNGTVTAWNDEPTVLGNMVNPAGGYGHAYMRSDWTSSATYASFRAGPVVMDIGNGHENYDQNGSLLLQRGSNTLLVEPRSECLRNAPAAGAGAGAALWTNAQNCFANAVFLRGGAVYKQTQTYGTPSMSGTPPDHLTLSTNAQSSGNVLNFASTTGVVPGMVAIGTNIPQPSTGDNVTSGGTYVSAVTSTTVTLTRSLTPSIPSSTSVTFGAAGRGDFNSRYSQFANSTYAAPASTVPICTGPGSPYVSGTAFTITSGHSTDAFSVPISTPLTSSWGNGTPLLFAWPDSATVPTYYQSGNSGPTSSLSRSSLYILVNWNSNGSTATFGIIPAPSQTPYPTSGTALTMATAGSGVRVRGDSCGSGIQTSEITSHPTRIDLLESTSSYAYARGVGIEASYGGNPSGYQREVFYLRPKLFLVYDRVRTAHSNAQAVNWTGLVDADGNGNSVQVYVSGKHPFHSGMQVKVANCTANNCGSTLNNNTYTITVYDDYYFGLNGATTPIGCSPNCATTTGTATGNIWGHQVTPWNTGPIPTEVTTAGQASAGMRQWYVAAPPVNIASITDGTPVTVTTSTPHGLNNGFAVNLAGIMGNWAAVNGVWTVTVPNTGTASDLTTFTLNGSNTYGYGAGGAVGTVQKFNGAITTVLPKNPGVILQDVNYAPGLTSGYGLAYRLEVHDPRNCTSNPTWCQASNPDTTDSENWLTVLDASQNASDTAAIAPLTATNADMVQVGTNAVAGFQNAQIMGGNCSNGTCSVPSLVLPINYAFTQPAGTVNHYITGFAASATYNVDTSQAGRVSISNNGSGTVVRASANGILSFSTQGGAMPAQTTISGSLQVRGTTSIR